MLLLINHCTHEKGENSKSEVFHAVCMQIIEHNCRTTRHYKSNIFNSSVQILEKTQWILAKKFKRKLGVSTELKGLKIPVLHQKKIQCVV